MRRRRHRRGRRRRSPPGARSTSRWWSPSRSAVGVRFTQLQTLAQYGRERLTERGDAVRIRDAMARHFAQLCSQSAAAFTGDVQRAWLTAMDPEHDNLRAALDWAVANDDAETALMIAGGAAWPHWLTGMVVEGRRWLDDAFACAGEADERTRALALTGRGLLDFLAGATEHCDDDLATALEIFERHGDVESMALAHSFYAEQAAVRGDLDEARRRRRVVLDFYGRSTRGPLRRRGPHRTRWPSWPSSTATSTRPSVTTEPPPRASGASTGRS